MKRNSFKWCVYTFLFLGIGMVSCADEDLMTAEFNLQMQQNSD